MIIVLMIVVPFMFIWIYTWLATNKLYQYGARLGPEFWEELRYHPSSEHYGGMFIASILPFINLVILLIAIMHNNDLLKQSKIVEKDLLKKRERINSDNLLKFIKNNMNSST